ncbi:transaldolase [Thermoascus aurantiacus ATCC 26904]
MASGETGLQALRKRTIVDLDSMDEEVAKDQNLGPFEDCTSNQGIAYAELVKPKHVALLEESISHAEKLLPEYPGLKLEELAVEIAMVSLALKIAPHIRGRVHIQTNPYYSYSTEKTIANAIRITRLFRYLQPGFDTSRVCLKIPSTWEGLLACRTLEQSGIRTLATTLFTLTQAALAAEVGCTYAAPYVNQLKVHLVPGFTDPNKLGPLCVAIQRYYTSIQAKTQVLPASLTSTDEILSLAGVHHITIGPGLLEQLSKLDSSTTTVKSLFDEEPSVPVPDSKISYLNDPATYRIVFTRDLGGASEEKLTQAINIFCDMQDKLEDLIKQIQSSKK